MIIKMVSGSGIFKSIPENIRIKIALRCCIHGNITDIKVSDIIEKIGRKLSKTDKSIYFLLDDFFGAIENYVVKKVSRFFYNTYKKWIWI